MVFTLRPRHTLALWQRAVALVQTLVVQASFASRGVVKPSVVRPTESLMSDLDGDAIIAKYCNALGDRARYDADLSSTVLSDLSCAIVIVNAFWSGPSMQTLVRIANVIADVDSDRRIN